MPGRDTTGPQGKGPGSGWGKGGCYSGQENDLERQSKRNQIQNRGINLCKHNRFHGQHFRRGPWNR